MPTCGCHAVRERTVSGQRGTRSYAVGEILKVIHCPLHAASPDLASALLTVRSLLARFDQWSDVLHVWLNHPNKPEVTLGAMIDAALLKAGLDATAHPNADSLPAGDPNIKMESD